MNQRLKKISQDIVNAKSKIVEYQSRLRELERLKIEVENADIVALVRGVDVAPDELRAFIEAYKQEKAGIKPMLAKQEESINEN